MPTKLEIQSVFVFIGSHIYTQVCKDSGSRYIYICIEAKGTKPKGRQKKGKQGQTV